MSTLVLVRHGQASFGGPAYDELSDLGLRQGELLRSYWLGRGETFDEVWSGSLARQRDSARLALVQPQVDPRWNEYDADAILARLGPGLAERRPEFRALWAAHLAAPRDPRTFQRMFEPLMLAWVTGEAADADVEPWAAFRDRVRAVLADVMAAPHSRRVAVFASGGPIGVAVMTVLGAPDWRALELNWRLRNGSLTTFLFSPGRVSLDGFNATPHLALAEETFR